jgi:hypothetical protein
MYRRAVVPFLVVVTLASTRLPASETGERFTFSVAGAPKTALGDERLRVSIHEWSSDAERDKAAAAIAANDTQAVRHALLDAKALGYLSWPGGSSYTIRYARRSARPDGGADLILVADSRIWVWWDAKNDLPANEPFTVLQIRLDKSGNGEGKIAPASAIRRDAASGIAMADYDTRPVLIRDVKPLRS